MSLEGHCINVGSCLTLCNASGRWLLLVLQGLSTGETAETAAINSMLPVVAKGGDNALFFGSLLWDERSSWFGKRFGGLTASGGLFTLSRGVRG